MSWRWGKKGAAAALLGLFGAVLASGTSAETILTVTQTSYDVNLRPQCVALRMDATKYASGLPTDACTGTTPPSSTNGPDRITKTVYDAAGQVTQLIQAYGTSDQRVYSTVSYGSDGEVIDTIDALGNRTHRIYDGYNRLVTLNYPSTTLPASYNPSTQATALSTAGAFSTTDYETYAYDLNNNRLSTRRRDAVMIYDCYDNLDRTVRESVGSNSCTTSGGSADVFTQYDGLGRITAKRFSSTTNSQGVFYVYDGLGRVTSTTDFNGRTVSYLYNQASARTRTTYPDGSFVDWGSGLSGYNKLDALNRVTNPKHSSTSTLYSITYNSLGQRTKLNRGPTNNAVTNYTYDGVGRLATFNDDLTGTTGDITWTFSYSPASQIVSWSATSSAYDYVEPATSTVSQSYDGLNRDAAIASISGGYDLKGNITKDATRVMTYDTFNRFLTAAPVGTPATHNTDLVYDPEGRLAKYSSDNGSTWISFVYDGTNLIQEYSGATSTVLRTYVHGPGTDEPEVWYEGSGFNGRHFLVPNYQGSIIATTDSGGNLENTYEYGPYGEPQINKANPATTNPWTTTNLHFRYTGQMVLPYAQLYYYKARVYDPVYGHFLQTDPIGTKDDLDLYAYVAGDPVNQVDPTGTQCVTSVPGGCPVFMQNAYGHEASLMLPILRWMGKTLATGYTNGCMDYSCAQSQLGRAPVVPFPITRGDAILALADGAGVMVEQMSIAGKVVSAELRFSQTTAGGGGKYERLVASMRKSGWQGAPIDVVKTGDGLTTIDNTRVLAAQDAGLTRIPAAVHDADEALPASMDGRFGDSKTWGEALEYRTSRQNPPLPTTGTARRPNVP